jgi:uncharacterized protein YjeT (DUF2065 family)
MNLDWSDLFAAVGLLLVLEGLMPFANPGATRRVFAQLAQLADRELRTAGIVSLGLGIALLFFVRS